MTLVPHAVPSAPACSAHGAFYFFPFWSEAQQFIDPDDGTLVTVQETRQVVAGELTVVYQEGTVSEGEAVGMPSGAIATVPCSSELLAMELGRLTLIFGLVTLPSLLLFAALFGGLSQEFVHRFDQKHRWTIFRCEHRNVLKYFVAFLVIGSAQGVLAIAFARFAHLDYIALSVGQMAAVLFLIRQHRRNARMIRSGTHCWKCHYDRSGLPDESSPCPECGFVNPTSSPHSEHAEAAPLG